MKFNPKWYILIALLIIYASQENFGIFIVLCAGFGVLFFLLQSQHKKIEDYENTESNEEDEDYTNGEWEDYYQEGNRIDDELEDSVDSSSLSASEKALLQEKYRRAIKLCHPDKIGEMKKSEAQKMFIAVRSAYEKEDLKELTLLLKQLEKSGV